MSALVTEITDTEFAAVTDRGLVLVDFWAPWCGPCQMQGPILDLVANQVGSAARIVKVNVDSNPDAPGHYGVSSIPTLILLKDGQLVQRFVGLQQAPALVAAITAAASA